MKKLILFLPLLIYTICPSAQIGTVESFSKISATEGNFMGTLNVGDHFSICEVIGDLNGDGFEDMAVGSRKDDDGGVDRGAVWILFLNQDRTVSSYQKISSTQGNFSGDIDNEDNFGCSVSRLGDVNNDGVLDIAVGAWSDDDGGINSGAVWILFLNVDGTVNSHQKISSTQGGINGLTQNRLFGLSGCGVGDLNNDGVPDIAVGAPNYDNDGGQYRGCIWILFLNNDGTVLEQQLINSNNGGFEANLADGDKFGYGLSNIGDLNNDGTTDIAVSALYDDDGGEDVGAVYILLLNDDGSVFGHQKISATEGGYTGFLSPNDGFGYSTVGIDDINADGVKDIAIGATLDDDGGENSGAVWILTLNSDGSVNSNQKISATEGGFNENIDDDRFGAGLSHFQTGDKELVVGSFKDDDGGEDIGAVWIIDIEKEGTSAVDDVVDKIFMNVYPNPCDDILNFQFDDNLQSKELEVLLFDNSGRVMIDEYIISQNKISIDVSKCVSGLYHLQIAVSGVRIEMKKVIIR